MTLERRTLALAADQAAAAMPTPELFTGHPAVFDSPSQDLGGFVEICAPGCFARSIAADDIRALVDHEPGRILGRSVAGTLRLAEDSVGLACEIDIPPTTLGRDTAILVARGDISGMSFGFYTDEDSWERRGDVLVRTLLRVTLVDVSIVTFPAYLAASVSVRAIPPGMVATPPPAAPPAAARRRAAMWLARTV